MSILGNNLLAQYYAQNSDPWRTWDVVYDVYVDDTTENKAAIQTRDLSNQSPLYVDWGDGSGQLIPRDSQSIYHQYSVGGLYTVKFKGCNEKLIIFRLFLSDTVSTVRTIRKISNCSVNTDYMPTIIGCPNANILDGIFDPRTTLLRNFSGCSSLALTSIPGTITTISSFAFRYCTSLQIRDIPPSVTSIGTYAFQGCKSLTEMTFHNILQLSQGAFELCSNLATIRVPWSEGAVANAPWGATNATIIYNYQP